MRALSDTPASVIDLHFFPVDRNIHFCVYWIVVLKACEIVLNSKCRLSFSYRCLFWNVLLSYKVFTFVHPVALFVFACHFQPNISAPVENRVFLNTRKPKYIFTLWWYFGSKKHFCSFFSSILSCLFSSPVWCNGPMEQAVSWVSRNLLALLAPAFCSSARLMNFSTHFDSGRRNRST